MAGFIATFTVAAPATSRRIVSTPADGAGGGGGSRCVDCCGDGSHQEEVRLHYRSFLK